MFCPTCRTENADSNSYCIAGGHSLNAQAMGKKPVSGGLEFCSSCGTKNHFSSAYCGQCGADVTKLKASDFASFVKPKVNVPSFTLPTVNSAITKGPVITGLISAAIAAVIVLILSFGVMSYVEGIIVDEAAEDGDRLTPQMLRSGSFISEAISEEMEMPITIPKLYDVGTVAALLNGVNVEASMNYAYDFYEYNDIEKVTFNASNILSIGMIVMFIALIAMGVYIGWKAKKSNESILLPLAVGIAAYTVFVMICAWTANFNFSLGQVGVGDFWIEAKIAFSAIGSIGKTIVAGIIVAGLSALLMKYGKKSFSVVQQLPIWPKYTVLSGAALSFIVVASSLFFYIYLLLNKSELNKAFNFESDQTIVNVLAVFLLPHFVNFVHLSSIDLQAFEYTQQMLRGSLSAMTSKNDFVTLWASSLSDKEQVKLLYNLKGGLWYLPKLSVLIPVALFIYAGHKLFTQLRANIKEIAIFAGIYGVFLVILSIFTKGEFLMADRYGVNIGTSLISAFLLPFIIAFVCLAIGAYVRERRDIRSSR